MGIAWTFIDEHGDIKFGERNSKFFGLAAVTTRAPIELCRLLDTVRHDCWSSQHIRAGWFHANSNCWDVRRFVFEAFEAAPIERCDVVSLSKARIFPQLREPLSMYRVALRILLRYLVPTLSGVDELRIVAAQWSPLVPDLCPLLKAAVTQPGHQHHVLWNGPLEVMQAPASAHAGLQFADYLAWASVRRRISKDDEWIQMIQKQGRGFSDFLPF